ncbi:transcriptional regulator [Bacillus pseudomycoides]|uniref:RrF2 family transcriptional regulator n=1 Tax=Bacillus pseudomycoides TaxID=64104 RepID=UPI000BF99FD8|nr:Rrf2 family transcriptional regulator [Bacillus pseudomycoides]PGE89413.1 transcriptional regulator [Bacillus pseudomycoides]
MRIKSGMEQAVYTLLLLTRVPDRNTLTSEAISERLDVSPSYLKKLMRLLVQAGLVESITGTKGGFSLARSPKKITLYDIFQAVEGRGAFFQGKGMALSVFDSKETHPQEDCVLARVMKKVEDKWAQAMSEETLTTLMEQIEEFYDVEKVDEWIREKTLMN